MIKFEPSKDPHWYNSIFNGEHKFRETPSFPEFFMGLAWAVKEKSPDYETQHGCVLVDKFWRVISIGYNGFVPGIEDNKVPNTRPEKYKFVAGNHADTNAIHNASIDLRNRDGVKCFLTGFPCLPCFSALLTVGIKEFYILNRPGTQMEDNLDRAIRDYYIQKKNVDFYIMNMDEIEWIKGL
jgi:dCMP deaminase